jgi:hypothetical protein
MSKYSICRLFEICFQYAYVLHPIIFCRTYWNCAGPEFTKFSNLNGINDGNNKNPTRHVFKYKHTKWSHWCITASLNYKNTMINRITMETVACLRSKCHMKQNLILSWPWSFRHTSCISDFRCKTKYTNKKFCRTPGPAYLAVLPVLVIFCPLGPTNFKKSAIVQWKRLKNITCNSNWQIISENEIPSDKSGKMTAGPIKTLGFQDRLSGIAKGILSDSIFSDIWFRLLQLICQFPV